MTTAETESEITEKNNKSNIKNKSQFSYKK